MKSSREIDKSLRDEVSKKRASQHALEVIHNMAIPAQQFSKLYQLLLDLKLKITDANALNKLNKHPLFEKLTDVQKSKAINKTLEQSRFMDKEAELIILSELMNGFPKDYRDNTLNWINYLVQSLIEITSYIHPNIEHSANNLQRKQFRATLSKLNNHLSWVWNHEYKENKSCNELNKSLIGLTTSEETQTGYKFRLY